VLVRQEVELLLEQPATDERGLGGIVNDRRRLDLAGDALKDGAS
jgi:hypothetical protein